MSEIIRMTSKQIIIPLPPTLNTMRSTQLHEIIFNETGKYAKLGHFHDHLKKVLVNQLNVILASSELLPNGHVKHYNLTEVQVEAICNASGLSFVGGRIVSKITEGTRLKYEHGALCAVESLLGITLIRQYNVDGYRIDGYDVENNIAYEVDEPHHVSNGAADHKRQCYIENKLGCTFKRIAIK